MSERIFNFSAGPAVLPEPVLEEAREALWSLGDTGIGIMEHSHRGSAFKAVLAQTEDLCRRLAGIRLTRPWSGCCHVDVRERKRFM